MDSRAFSALLVDSVIRDEPLAEVWAVEIQERGQILDVIFSFLLSPELLDLVSLPELIAVLEAVSQ